MDDLKAAARKLLSFRAGAELQTRINYLREGANEGILPDDEDIEYKQFIEALDILSIMQAKARKKLAEDR